MITKKMVNNYLSEDYHEWITNLITDICNDCKSEDVGSVPPEEVLE
jgi:hypothetical protein